MSTDFRCRQCGHSKPQAASRCLNAECPISHISQPLRGVNRVTSASAPETHPNPHIPSSIASSRISRSRTRFIPVSNEADDDDDSAPPVSTSTNVQNNDNMGNNATPLHAVATASSGNDVSGQASTSGQASNDDDSTPPVSTSTNVQNNDNMGNNATTLNAVAASNGNDVSGQASSSGQASNVSNKPGTSADDSRKRKESEASSDLFTCSVCLTNPMKPPIMISCTFGHSVCADCFCQLHRTTQKCPQCRMGFPAVDTRNILVENIVETHVGTVPCYNGCGASVVYHDWMAHDKVCPYYDWPFVCAGCEKHFRKIYELRAHVQTDCQHMPRMRSRSIALCKSFCADHKHLCRTKHSCSEQRVTMALDRFIEILQQGEKYCLILLHPDTVAKSVMISFYLDGVRNDMYDTTCLCAEMWPVSKITEDKLVIHFHFVHAAPWESIEQNVHIPPCRLPGEFRFECVCINPSSFNSENGIDPSEHYIELIWSSP